MNNSVYSSDSPSGETGGGIAIGFSSMPHNCNGVFVCCRDYGFDHF